MTKKQNKPFDRLTLEREAYQLGYGTIAGIDEAGRGPLAGPVVASALYIPYQRLNSESKLLQGLQDSKKLTEKKREALYQFLMHDSECQIGVGVCSEKEIDQLNILGATHTAMRRAVEALPQKPDFALVDGLSVNGLPIPHRAIVKGDARSLLIGGASIVAKVTRDRMMHELDKTYPGYGFARHKGYGTKAHLAALASMGPCPIHRKTFQPIAGLLEDQV